jgi:hypothetical protein
MTGLGHSATDFLLFATDFLLLIDTITALEHSAMDILLLMDNIYIFHSSHR